MEGSYFNSYSVPVNAYYPASVPQYLPYPAVSSQYPVQQTQISNYNGYQYVKSYVYPQINQCNIPWVTDPVINEAINKLREVKYLPGDVEHMKKLGVNIIFNNGEEAVRTILEKGLKVEFGPVSNPKVHAQWEQENNKIVINEKYKGTKDMAVILAVSEAIAHELGHAKDGDNKSSIQEELDCLALNTLANRYHQYYYPQVFSSAGNADIINDGVGLYTRLFFDPDPQKQGLVSRVIEKYGQLPLESPNHTAPVSARIVKNLRNVN